MASNRQRWKATVRRAIAALRREDGNATIEAVLWLPFYIAMFTMVVDATMIFHNNSQILRITQDANRALSVGRYETETETENSIKTALNSLSTNITATTVIDNGIISTTVTVPTADIDVIGMFSGLSQGTLTVVAQHMQEV